MPELRGRLRSAAARRRALIAAIDTPRHLHRAGPYTPWPATLLAGLVALSFSLGLTIALHGQSQAYLGLKARFLNSMGDNDSSYYLSRSSDQPNSSTSEQANDNTTDLRQDDEPTQDMAVRVTGIVLTSITFITGLCGNILIMTVITMSKRDATVTDIFIGNLAAADIELLFTLILFIGTMYHKRWIFGSLACKLFMALTSFSQFASSFLLVAMSIDRYIAICHPIFAQRFRQRFVAIIISLVIWIACSFLMTPIFLFARTNEDNNTCAIFWPEYENTHISEMVYVLYSFILGYAVPLVIIFTMYGLIILKLWRVARAANQAGSSRRAQHKEAANRLVGHLVFYIIFGYAGCWGPYWLTQLALCFMSTEQPPGFYTIALMSNCLSYVNSALNPILYAFLTENFRRRCAEVFGFKRSSSRSSARI